MDCGNVVLVGDEVIAKWILLSLSLFVIILYVSDKSLWKPLKIGQFTMREVVHYVLHQPRPGVSWYKSVSSKPFASQIFFFYISMINKKKD